MGSLPRPNTTWTPTATGPSLKQHRPLMQPNPGCPQTSAKGDRNHQRAKCDTRPWRTTIRCAVNDAFPPFRAGTRNKARLRAKRRYPIHPMWSSPPWSDDPEPKVPVAYSPNRPVNGTLALLNILPCSIPRPPGLELFHHLQFCTSPKTPRNLNTSHCSLANQFEAVIIVFHQPLLPCLWMLQTNGMNAV